MIETASVMLAVFFVQMHTKEGKIFARHKKGACFSTHQNIRPRAEGERIRTASSHTNMIIILLFLSFLPVCYALKVSYRLFLFEIEFFDFVETHR